MNKYEITIITAEDLKEEPVKKEIETLGGKILGVSSIGNRQLTFKIKGQEAGFYTSVNFELDSTKVIELVKKLNLKSEILRSLIITAPPAKIEMPIKEKVEKATEIQEAPEILPAPANEVKPETVSEAVAEVEKAEEMEKEEKAEEKEKPVKKVRAPKKEKKVEEIVKEEPIKESKVSKEIEAEELSTEDRLKALDKKLDELLKE